MNAPSRAEQAAPQKLCKTHLPDIPDQHIAQMVAGLDVLLFRPDAELRRLARLAIGTEVEGRSSKVEAGRVDIARRRPTE